LGKLSGNLEGNNNINPFGNKSGNVSSNPIDTGTVAPKRRGNLDSRSRSGILQSDDMGLEGSIQGVKPPVEPTPAMKLHQQLKDAGAYERLGQVDPRRGRMLQTYLTTEKSTEDIGKEIGLSRSRSTELLHSAMDIAFFALREEDRAEYNNNPANALRTITAQRRQKNLEQFQQSHRNEETGKIEFSETHRQRLTEANLRRWENAREEQKAAQSENNSQNVSPNQFTTSGRRDLVAPTPSSNLHELMKKLGEAKQGNQTEDQPSE